MASPITIALGATAAIVSLVLLTKKKKKKGRAAPQCGEEASGRWAQARGLEGGGVATRSLLPPDPGIVPEGWVFVVVDECAVYFWNDVLAPGWVKDEVKTADMRQFLGID